MTAWASNFFPLLEIAVCLNPKLSDFINLSEKSVRSDVSEVRLNWWFLIFLQNLLGEIHGCGLVTWLGLWFEMMNVWFSVRVSLDYLASITWFLSRDYYKIALNFKWKSCLKTGSWICRREKNIKSKFGFFGFGKRGFIDDYVCGHHSSLVSVNWQNLFNVAKVWNVIIWG